MQWPNSGDKIIHGDYQPSTRHRNWAGLWRQKSFMKLFAIILLFASCTKPAEMVHLSFTSETGRVYYAFTYQGAPYSPQDTTEVITDNYRVTLPGNEPTGYINPVGYVSGAAIQSVVNPSIKISF